MPDLNRRTALRWLSASLAGTALAQQTVKPLESAKPPAAPPRPIDTPLDIAVPVPPTAFRADGKTHLVYEVHVTNFGRTECTLTRFEALPPGGTALANLSGDSLSHLITRPGPPQKDPLRIEGGLRAVIFAWIDLDADPPSSLVHRVACKIGEYPDEFVAECAPIPVRRDLVAISPPLRGDNWMAANGPGISSGHRRSMIPVGGGAHIAQRFAIDWLQVRESGQSFEGDRLDNKNYRCYGSDALAVADGVVVAVKDGIPENIPGATSRAVPITLETVGGNHVILDLGGGHFAFYAHLQPGKIRVKIGDRARRGQERGLVGNSGNSTEPHLHFHICDRNSPLASEGLPYAFTSFEVQGKGEIKVEAGAMKIAISQDGRGRRTMEMPLQNEVVRFS